MAVIATHLRPAQGFGGVAESTSELIRAWRGMGREIEVVVSDGTLGRPLVTADFERELGSPTRVYHSTLAVRWGFGWLAPVKIARSIWNNERVYISGVATWPNTLAAFIARALGRHHVVALRGALMPEHWREISSGRPFKTLFYKLIVFPALRNATAIHASSELEATAADAIVSGMNTFVVPNGFAAPTLHPAAITPPMSSGLTLLYLGRLSREKGILGFARRFAEIRGPEDQLWIAGTGSGAYADELLQLCSERNGVKYLGVQPRDRLAELFAQSHALVLPSGVDGGAVQENFGNVVVEALLHARPALVTRSLAWDQIEEDQVGMLLDRDLGRLGEVLNKLRTWIEDGQVWLRCQSYGQGNFSAEVSAETIWNAVFARTNSRPGEVRY